MKSPIRLIYISLVKSKHPIQKSSGEGKSVSAGVLARGYLCTKHCGGLVADVYLQDSSIFAT